MTLISGLTSDDTPIVIKSKGFIREENEKFVDVAAGVEHALLLSQSGHIWAVGSNTYGQLGSRKVIGYTVQPVDVTAKLNLDAYTAYRLHALYDKCLAYIYRCKCISVRRVK